MIGECPTGADAFNLVENKNIRGGVKDPDSDSLAECFASCLSDSEEDCAGFDWDGSDCWKLNADKNAGTKYDNTNVDHYDRKPCGMIVSHFVLASPQFLLPYAYENGLGEHKDIAFSALTLTHKSLCRIDAVVFFSSTIGCAFTQMLYRIHCLLLRQGHLES